MLVRLLVLMVFAIAACSAVAPTTPPTATYETPAEPPSEWALVMRQVEQHYKVIQVALTSSPIGNLQKVADAAGAAAELMRLGYGRHEHKQVPGFARFARGTESWFLQLALEASQAHGDIARELFRNAHEEHCDHCHAASHQGHG